MSYRRIMLKLSGEALAGQREFGMDYDALHAIAAEIIEMTNEKVDGRSIEMVVTIGAGNIWRYRDMKDSGIERTASDAMGMLATIMNAVALQSSLEEQGAHCRVCSAIDVPQLAEPYLQRRAVRHLEKGRIVICAGGTGNPFFTTDSAAALRALELDCDVIIKATNVDGVYDSDPNTNPDAKKYDEITLQQAIEQNLHVMDQAALSLCRDQGLPIVVFDFTKRGDLKRVVQGQSVGTKVIPV